MLDRLNPLTPDSRLAALAGQGDERAFELLIARHRRQLLARCRRVLGPDRAEDALQQGLMGAWLALGHGVSVDEPRAWLHAVVHNAAIKIATRSAAKTVELPEMCDGRDGPEGDVVRREQVRALLAAVFELPAQQREALLQTALEGRSYASVANELGISEGAVRGMLQRARASLRERALALLPFPLIARLWNRGSRIVRHPAGSAAAPAALVKAGALALAVAGAAGVALAMHSSPGHHAAGATAMRIEAAAHTEMRAQPAFVIAHDSLRHHKAQGRPSAHRRAAPHAKQAARRAVTVVAAPTSTAAAPTAPAATSPAPPASSTSYSNAGSNAPASTGGSGASPSKGGSAASPSKGGSAAKGGSGTSSGDKSGSGAMTGGDQGGSGGSVSSAPIGTISPPTTATASGPVPGGSGGDAGSGTSGSGGDANSGTTTSSSSSQTTTTASDN